MHSWHLYVLRLTDEAPRRDQFVAALAAQGIGTSVHFIPLHEHTYWRSFAPHPDATMPVAVEAAPRAVSLPIYSSMTDLQVERVVRAVCDVVAP